MANAEDLGNYIRKAREDAGLTQAELAEAVGMSRPTITQLERGQVKFPRIQLLAAIAQALNISPAGLFTQAGVSSPDAVPAQLQWLANQLDDEGNELLVELGHALLRERQRRREKGDRRAVRPRP